MTKSIQRLAHNSVVQLMAQGAIGIVAVIAGLLLKDIWTMRDAQGKFETSLAVMGYKIDALTQVSQDRASSSDVKYLQTQIDDVKKRQDRAEAPRLTVRAQVPARAK